MLIQSKAQAVGILRYCNVDLSQLRLEEMVDEATTGRQSNGRLIVDDDLFWNNTLLNNEDSRLFLKRHCIYSLSTLVGLYEEWFNDDNIGLGHYQHGDERNLYEFDDDQDDEFSYDEYM